MSGCARVFREPTGHPRLSSPAPGRRGWPGARHAHV